jgi:ATP-dependent DNA helicase RecG
MNWTPQNIDELLNGAEGERLEFKTASLNFHFEELVKYCSALANEGGGSIVLGVSDKRPRTVVGTKAFIQPERTRSTLIEKLHLNVGFSDIRHPQGRVLAFHVPPRPLGMPIKANGIYWSRRGDSLVAMDENQLRSVFSESGRDFSAEVCTGATMNDLDSGAIDDFRQKWVAKTANQKLLTLSDVQLLTDAEAVIDGQITNAALILFGTRSALGVYLPQAELIFEYRSTEASGPAQQRVEFREGFFCCYEDLQEKINYRNDLQHFQSGLFVLDVPTFDDRVIREALLNAVSHRDYQLAGSIFLRQYPRRLVVESPGGFPLGVNESNILDRHSPRNRRIADIFSKCGLVERSGQGMNLIFETSIRQSKQTPDFSGTDQYQVILSIDGQVHDPQFLVYLEKIGREKLAMFSTGDFLLLDLIHREQLIPSQLTSRARTLVEMGVIERIGRGRGVRYMLSRTYYSMIGQKGTYTRKKGLDHETNKALLLRHIEQNTRAGCRFEELMQVLPALSRGQIQRLLKDLKIDGKIEVHGVTRAATWHKRFR